MIKPHPTQGSCKFNCSDEEHSGCIDYIEYVLEMQGLSYKVGGGCVLTLCPLTTINRQQLDQALEIVEAGIAELAP